MSCSLFLLLTTTTYLFYNVTYYFLIARGFLWSSVMLLLYLNRLLSCVSIHLTSLHFPCCCSVISLKDAFSLFFRYLYTKFFLLLKAMPCLMIAFFSSCIHKYHLCMLEEKKDTRTKNKEWEQIGCSKEDRKPKKYFCYYNSQSASAAVLSFKLPTTTTYYSYFTREIEHKIEV